MAMDGLHSMPTNRTTMSPTGRCPAAGTRICPHGECRRAGAGPNPGRGVGRLRLQLHRCPAPFLTSQNRTTGHARHTLREPRPRPARLDGPGSLSRCGLDDTSPIAGRIDAGITIVQVQDILVAVAPVTGTPLALSPAANISRVFGVVVIALEAEVGADEDVQKE
jgi:hypothetical protein